MTTREQAKQIARSLNDKAYSESFVAAEIATTIPFQIRAMRKERHWTQKDLADKTGQFQKVISDFENPDIGPKSVDSLLRIAAAFDVGLIVRFAPFSELVDWSVNFSKKAHFVPTRAADRKLRSQQRGRLVAEEMSTFVQTTLNFGNTASAAIIRIADWKAQQA